MLANSKLLALTFKAPKVPSPDCCESFMEVFFVIIDCLTSMSRETYRLSDFRIDFKGIPQLPIKFGWNWIWKYYLSRDMTKPTKWVCAQWRFRSAWASAQSNQSLLCAQWVAMDPRFLHGDSEDSDQTGRMPRLIWVFAGQTLILLVLSCCGSFIDNTANSYSPWGSLTNNY